MLSCDAAPPAGPDKHGNSISPNEKLRGKMKKLRVVLFTLIVTAGFVSGQNLNGQGQNGYGEGLGENPGATLGAIAVIGDSLSAGFQNGTLLGCQQPNGYANLVVDQAVSSGKATSRLFLPLMSSGIPPVLPPFTPMRMDPSLQATDLAVPGQTVGQALTMRPVYNATVFPYDAANPVQTLTNYVLGFPGVFTQVSKSQVEWANALNPDTIVVWLGNNDVIGVFEGVQATITDPLTFARNYDQLLSSLAKSHRRIVVANIPDITLTPFMISLLPKLQQQDPLIALKLKGYVAAYNAIISIIAAKKSTPVVDVYSLVNKLAADGFTAGVQMLTTQAGGGLFSIDGIHPTNTGYAIIANEFIKTINRAYEMKIQSVDVVSIANADPLTPFYLKDGFLGWCVVPDVQLH